MVFKKKIVLLLFRDFERRDAPPPQEAPVETRRRAARRIREFFSTLPSARISFHTTYNYEARRRLSIIIIILFLYERIARTAHYTRDFAYNLQNNNNNNITMVPFLTPSPSSPGPIRTQQTTIVLLHIVMRVPTHRERIFNGDNNTGIPWLRPPVARVTRIRRRVPRTKWYLPRAGPTNVAAVTVSGPTRRYADFISFFFFFFYDTSESTVMDRFHSPIFDCTDRSRKKGIGFGEKKKNRNR